MQPLDNVRVVDFTRLYPGPLATSWLADYGADVIKIEQPGLGDFSRLAKPKYLSESVYFQTVNRNKRSLAADLKSPQGMEVVLSLIATADVLVESFRFGVMDRLGLGYETLHERFPQLIYVSMSGFGAHGPYSNIAGHDLSVTGVTGGLDFRWTEASGRPPIIPALPLADSHGAMLTFMGVMLALTARARGQDGQYVDIALSDAMAGVLAAGAEEALVGPVAAEDKPQTRLGTMPRYNVYECADGKWVTLGCLEPHLWKQFCDAVERPDWTSRTEGLENRLVDRGPDREQLLADMRTMFLTRPSAAWVELLTQASVACLPANRMSEVFDDPHLVARDLLHCVDHPTEGTVNVIGVPVKLSATPGSVRHRAPQLGEHTRAVASALGYSDDEITGLVQAGILAEGSLGTEDASPPAR